MILSLSPCTACTATGVAPQQHHARVAVQGVFYRPVNTRVYLFSSPKYNCTVWESTKRQTPRERVVEKKKMIEDREERYTSQLLFPHKKNGTQSDDLAILEVPGTKLTYEKTRDAWKRLGVGGYQRLFCFTRNHDSRNRSRRTNFFRSNRPRPHHPIA